MEKVANSGKFETFRTNHKAGEFIGGFHWNLLIETRWFSGSFYIQLGNFSVRYNFTDISDSFLRRAVLEPDLIMHSFRN